MKLNKIVIKFRWSSLKHRWAEYRYIQVINKSKLRIEKNTDLASEFEHKFIDSVCDLSNGVISLSECQEVKIIAYDTKYESDILLKSFRSHYDDSLEPQYNVQIQDAWSEWRHAYEIFCKAVDKMNSAIEKFESAVAAVEVG